MVSSHAEESRDDVPERSDRPTGAEPGPAADDVVIDLRDTPGGSPLRRPASGRPTDLAPGSSVVTITGGDLWMQTEAFVYDIYRQVGFCAASPRNRVEELARWDERSRFHAVIDDRGEVIGAVRTIFGPYAELPVGQFTRTDASHPDPVCELSSLTVSPDVRSTGVIENLYRTGWLDAFRSRSQAVVALIDDWLLEVFVDLYHMPFTVIGEPREYMGGAPIPVALPGDGEGYSSLAAGNPEFWRWILEAVTPEEAAEWGLPTTIGDGEVVIPGAGITAGAD